MDRSFRGIRFDEHSFESFVIGVIFVELVERGTCIQFFFLLNFFWKSYFIPRNGECLVKCIILFNLLLNSFRFTHPQQNSPFLKYYHFLFVSLDKLFQQNFPSFHPGIFAAIQEISKSLSRYVLPNNEDTYSHTEGGGILSSRTRGSPRISRGSGGWRSIAKKLIETYLRLRRILKQSAKETRK